MPFFYLVVGYTIMLTIDKVVFDTHDILDHGEHGEHGEKISTTEKVLRQSIANIIQGEDLRVSQVKIEDALKKSLSHSLRKSQVFADKMKDAKDGVSDPAI